MLTSLYIQNIVLIDQLDLELQSGLTALTGETGAGKSILLDALGLALGGRGDASLVRTGCERGSVTASFSLQKDHPVNNMLNEQGIACEDELVLRRIQMAGGSSRALVNDQPVSVGFLNRLGRKMCEIHGQHETRALVDPGVHLSLLDAYGNLSDKAGKVAALWKQLAQIHRELSEHKTKLERAEVEQAFLAHAIKELRQLSPVEGEEIQLADKRQMMMHAEKFTDAVDEAKRALKGDGTLEAGLNASLRKLEMRRDEASGRLDEACSALDRVVVEMNEAREVLNNTLGAFQFDPFELEKIEERLFALRAQARKHKVVVDDLPGLLTRYEAEFDAIEEGGARLAKLEEQERKARQEYVEQARQLSHARRLAAEKLDAAVVTELGPLRLEKARFVTRIDTDEHGGGAHGIDDVLFTVSANPGTPLMPIGKAASGGELSRFMLALKVVLAECGSAPVLVFDEIDAGVGGAVADAIGKRLARLADKLQVLTITHSPQVAARAGVHLLIAKISEVGEDDEKAVTRVSQLPGDGRREEIARMLSGASVTPEARAQADRLIAGGG